jgi:hypothetical protein
MGDDFKESISASNKRINALKYVQKSILIWLHFNSYHEEHHEALDQLRATKYLCDITA